MRRLDGLKRASNKKPYVRAKPGVSHGKHSTYGSGCRCEKCSQGEREYVRIVCGHMRDFIQGLKSKPCMDCNNCFPPECMDFDHRPGTVKKSTVSRLVNNHSREVILVEIAKCDLVCSNCHRTRTKKRKQWSKF